MFRVAKTLSPRQYWSEVPAVIVGSLEENDWNCAALTIPAAELET